MKTHVWISTLVFLAALGGAEIAARRMLPVVPAAEDVPRNPYRFRGWPEYIRLDPAPTGTARIILISNSQAYAGEIPERRIYPDKLERALTAKHIGGYERIEVLNWSFDGVTSIELMLMAARLHNESPDLVIAAIGAADFSSFNLTRPLSQTRTDLPRLASRERIWRVLPHAFKKRHVRLEDWLTYAAWDRLALLRFRDFAWSWLDEMWSGVQTGLYSPGVNYHPWRLASVKKRGSLGSPPWLKRGAFEVTYTPEARVLLEEYLDALQAIPARRLLVIATPHQLPPTDPLYAPDQLFLKDLRELAAKRGLLFWDDSALFPPSAFFDGLHFKADFHQYYCDRLMERLPQLFEDGR
ncbi:MAG: hypothetical protein J5I99_08765 [Verrucomicrobia bacterium]|nr:hypothetical protein [Kiritimatiellia bacterium]MCO6401303.1 hypothetical protein [Verrucomicrobiota bacterium]